MHDLLLLLVGGLLGGAAYLLARRGSTDSRALESQLAQLSAQLNERMKETSGALHATQASVGQRLDHASAMVGLLERKLGALEESSRRIHALGEGLQELRDVLKSPKLRGNLGEFFLEDLLRQVLPAEHFRMQHAFRSGETVDAAVQIGEGLVCIDSKFPLEGFLRLRQLPADDEEGRRRERKAFAAAVRRHADSIAKKYIVPDEATYDFALMYIPAENVFYETIVADQEEGLQAYLLERRVIAVSPSSLYAYLQVVVLGLRGLRVEAHARQLAQDLQRLGGELDRFRTEYAVLGKHLRNAAGSFDEGSRRLERFDARLGALGEPLGEETNPPANA